MFLSLVRWAISVGTAERIFREIVLLQTMTGAIYNLGMNKRSSESANGADDFDWFH
jgi:hypothetical protein